MRLLVDTANVESPGGRQLLVELVRALAERRGEGDRLFVVRREDEDPGDAPDGVDWVGVPRAVSWRGLWVHLSRRLPAIAGERGVDVAYSLSGLAAPRLVRTVPTVVSINNMLPFTPEQVRHFPVLSRDRLRLVVLRRAMAWACRVSDAVVFPSRFGQDTVARWAGALDGKAFIAPNPIPDDVRIDPASPPPPPAHGTPFFFYLSVVYWYKNHLTLIEGYRRALRDVPGLPDLLMAGPPVDRAYAGRIERAVADPDLRGKARYLGAIRREEIPGLLYHATANVFPSLCETSSFVQGEILGAGGVMACSNVGPMPEVAGDAAETFDPRDADDIARVLIRLASEPALRDDLRNRARRRAADFTWDACGNAVWRAVRHARDGRRGAGT